MSELYTSPGFNDIFEYREPDIEYPLSDFNDLTTRRIIRHFEGQSSNALVVPSLNTRDEIYTDAFLVNRSSITPVDGELVRYSITYHEKPPSRIDFASMALRGAVSLPMGFYTYQTVVTVRLERAYFLIGPLPDGDYTSPTLIPLQPKQLINLFGFGFIDADFVAGANVDYRVTDDVLRRVEGNIWERTSTLYNNIQPTPS